MNGNLDCVCISVLNKTRHLEEFIIEKSQAENGGRLPRSRSEDINFQAWLVCCIALISTCCKRIVMANVDINLISGQGFLGLPQ